MNPVGSDLLSRHNKIVALEKITDPKEREQKINELIDKEGPKKRVFVERTSKSDAGLYLYDEQGLVTDLVK